MPFCRECGKEVQEDWITCPYCSQIIGAPAQSMNMQDSVVAGDITNTTIINQSQSSDKTEEIKNILELMIEEISLNNQEKADNLLDESRRINLRLHNEIYQRDFYRKEISARLEIMRAIAHSPPILSSTSFNQELGNIFYHYNKIEKKGYSGVRHLDYIGEYISKQSVDFTKTLVMDGELLHKWIRNQYLLKGENERADEFTKMMKQIYRQFNWKLVIAIFFIIIIWNSF